MSYPQGTQCAALLPGGYVSALERPITFCKLTGDRAVVDVDTFANNRLSITLMKDCPVGNLADLMSTEVATGGNVILEHLTDPRTHGSYDPAKAPLMHALKGPENESVTFFDWLRNTVGIICPARSALLTQCRAQPDREQVHTFLTTSGARSEQCVRTLTPL